MIAGISGSVGGGSLVAAGPLRWDENLVGRMAATYWGRRHPIESAQTWPVRPIIKAQLLVDKAAGRRPRLQQALAGPTIRVNEGDKVPAKAQ
ncbi:MAG TPA: hypothetical protein VF802_02445 [Candidatus Limnocylindrales bacterium]